MQVSKARRAGITLLHVIISRRYRSTRQLGRAGQVNPGNVAILVQVGCLSLLFWVGGKSRLPEPPSTSQLSCSLQHSSSSMFPRQASVSHLFLCQLCQLCHTSLQLPRLMLRLLPRPRHTLPGARCFLRNSPCMNQSVSPGRPSRQPTCQPSFWNLLRPASIQIQVLTALSAFATLNPLRTNEYCIAQHFD